MDKDTCMEVNNMEKFEIIKQSTVKVKKPNALSKAKYATYTMKKCRK